MGMVKGHNIEDGGLSAFLQELISLQAVGGAALGITKLVMDRGEEALSDKQKFVFDRHVLEPNTVKACKFCDGDIPWCEMLAALDNGGYCSWCANLLSKGD
jgi:hypothetical protein